MAETNKPALLTSQILSELMNNYYSLYLLDLSKKVITPLKVAKNINISSGDIKFTKEEILSVFGVLVKPEYLKKITEFFDTEKLAVLPQSKNMVCQQQTGRWRQITIQPFENIEGRNQRLICGILDITETKQMLDDALSITNAEAQDANEFKDLFFDAVNSAYASVLKIMPDSGETYHLIFKNHHIEEERIGSTWSQYYNLICDNVFNDDRTQFQSDTNYGSFGKVKEVKRVSFNYRSKIRSKDYRWYNTVMRWNEVNGKLPFVMLLTKDITTDMTERSRLKDVSEHDSLTYLFNRTKLESMVETEYQQLSSCAILFFDINNLKEVNDRSGHFAGDRLIAMVSDSIRAIMNRCIHGYRIGGDEFIVVVCNAKPKEVDAIVQKWKENLALVFANSDVMSSVAVGVAWSVAPFDFNKLQAEADIDMYRNKMEMKSALIKK